MRKPRANVACRFVADQSKDPIARKMRLRRGRRDQEEADQDQAKILKGMKDIAKDKNKQKSAEEVKAESVKWVLPAEWSEAGIKPTSSRMSSDFITHPCVSVKDLCFFGTCID